MDVSEAGRSLSAHSGSFSTSSGYKLDGDPSASSDDTSFSASSQFCSKEFARHKLPSKEVLIVFLVIKAVVLEMRVTVVSIENLITREYLVGL